MSRRTYAKIVTVGSTPVTVSFSSDRTPLTEVVVHNVAHLAPVYFRADGQTAVVDAATDTYVVTGYNGIARLWLAEPTLSVSVSLVSTQSGRTMVIAVEGV